MTQKNKIIIIGGIPGVGKTTIIDYALETAVKENFAINVVVFGTIMMDIAKEKYSIKNRDELRLLSPDIQKEIQKQTAQRIGYERNGKLILVDTHYAIKIGTGAYLQGIPCCVLDVLEPQLLVLIETDPCEISQRRKSDDSRLRDEESCDTILQHQEINRAIATTIAQKTGSLLYIIINKPNHAQQAAMELLNLLKMI